MPLAPLQPLTPLAPLSGGGSLHSLQPLVVPSGLRLRPLDYSGDLSEDGGGLGAPGTEGDFGGFGVSTGCLDPSCFGFAPASGPSMGGNFPDGCDPSTDPCGCDPCCGDPNCGGGGGGGGGGGVILVGGPGPGSQGGTINVSTTSSGGCGGSLLVNTGAFIACWLERLVILFLGIALVWGGIYLLKPAVATAPIRAVKTGAKISAAAAV